MANGLTARTRSRGRPLLLGKVLLTAAVTLPLACAGLAFGAQDAGTPGSGVAVDSSAPQGGSAPQTKRGRTEAASVEKHIATLHHDLHITPAQEPLWQTLASAMRQSVVKLDDVYAQRKKDYGSMSAVDDLKSYGAVQEVHARNVQSLIGPFEQLYDSFSPTQKKAADETLRSFTGNAIRNPR